MGLECFFHPFDQLFLDKLQGLLSVIVQGDGQQFLYLGGVQLDLDFF